MVIADTSAWIPFFNRPNSKEHATLDLLIDADEVVLVGVVLTELLQGCRSREERDELAEGLLALPYLDVTQTTWLKAGDLSWALLRKASRYRSPISSSPPWPLSIIATSTVWAFISRRFLAYCSTHQACHRRPSPHDS